jgi:hypothetical protein
MASMSWHSILSTAKLLGNGALIFGVFTAVIFGLASQKKRRITEYKKSGRFMDLLKIFSKY